MTVFRSRDPLDIQVVYMNLGPAVKNRIRELCRKKGCSFFELASRSGLPRETMIRIMKQNEEADIECIRKICAACGISLHDFFSARAFQPLIRVWR